MRPRHDADDLTEDTDRTRAHDDRPWSARARSWIVRPWVRQVTFIVLLVGFAVLVGVYMKVVNRYVHYSVRVEASPVIEPGGSAALRVTIYRPETLRPMQGTLELSQRAPDGKLTPVAQEPVASGRFTSLRLTAAPDAGDPLEYRLTVSVDGEQQARTIDLQVPVRPPVEGPGPVDGLPPDSPQARHRARTAAEAAGIRRISTSPSSSTGVEVLALAETGAPVRFLENRILFRVTDATGEPVADRDLEAFVPSPAGVTRLAARTDAHGLGVIRVTPQDVENWVVVIPADDGSDVRTTFEVVPSFDGLILQLDRMIVSRGGPIVARLATQLTADRWYYDVASGPSWWATGSRPIDATDVVIRPTGDDWYRPSGRVRMSQLQAYTAPFASSPQTSIRGFLMRPPELPERQAVVALIEALAARDRDDTYLAALTRLGLPAVSASPQELDRLVELFMAILRPAFYDGVLAYDDTASQTSELLAETTAFRRRVHWLLGLGLAGLLCSITGLVTVSTMRTRRRAAAVLEDISDPTIDLTPADGYNIAEGRAALLPIALALVTVGAFFVGVIFMLATM